MGFFRERRRTRERQGVNDEIGQGEPDLERDLTVELRSAAAASVKSTRVSEGENERGTGQWW